MAIDKTINVWQYSRWTYLLGRSVKFRYFTAEEREAIVTFLNAMLEKRPGALARFNIKRGNAYDFSNSFTYQNDYTLGKMLQVIGKDMKVKFPVEGEKALCDTLFAATDNRRFQAYKNYVTDEKSNSTSTSNTTEQASNSGSNTITSNSTSNSGSYIYS